jgi:monothiol glutaredoxin
MSTSPETLKQIEDLVKGNKVMLFMKGNRNFPQCGFSSTVVQILGSILDDYQTFNVLEDPAIRAGIKDYAQWPTIPQLYVNGEFLGGCDIIKQMSASGDLHKQLGVEKQEAVAPSISVTDSAITELKAAMADADDGDKIHIQIDLGFRHDMSVGPQEAGQVCTEVSGLGFCFDAASARRAEGLAIDFRSEGEETGFKLENPNKPKA